MIVIKINERPKLPSFVQESIWDLRVAHPLLPNNFLRVWVPLTHYCELEGLSGKFYTCWRFPPGLWIVHHSLASNFYLVDDLSDDLVNDYDATRLKIAHIIAKLTHTKGD